MEEVRRKRAARARRKEHSLGLDHRHCGQGSKRGVPQTQVAAKPPTTRACQGSAPFPQEHTESAPGFTNSGYSSVDCCPPSDTISRTAMAGRKGATANSPCAV